MSAYSQKFKIKNEYGFHARPAAIFVKAANKFSSDIKVEKDGIEISAKSIMGLLTIEGHQGSHITITAEGEDAAEAVKTLGALVESNFGES